jgi:hypothetical protein
MALYSAEHTATSQAEGFKNHNIEAQLRMNNHIRATGVFNQLRGNNIQEINICR